MFLVTLSYLERSTRVPVKCARLRRFSTFQASYTINEKKDALTAWSQLNESCIQLSSFKLGWMLQFASFKNYR